MTEHEIEMVYSATYIERMVQHNMSDKSTRQTSTETVKGDEPVLIRCSCGEDFEHRHQAHGHLTRGGD